MDIIGDYFSPNYEHTTANEKIDYSALVDHIKALMEDAQAIQILPFEETIHEGNNTVLRYFSKITKKNGLISNFAVIAIFEVQNYKIILFWELTKITLGDEKAGILDTLQ